MSESIQIGKKDFITTLYSIRQLLVAEDDICFQRVTESLSHEILHNLPTDLLLLNLNGKLDMVRVPVQGGRVITKVSA